MQKAILLIFFLLLFIGCKSEAKPTLTPEQKLKKEMQLADKKRLVSQFNDRGVLEGYIAILGGGDERDAILLHFAGRKDVPDYKMYDSFKKISEGIYSGRHVYLDIGLKEFIFTDFDKREWTYDIAKDTLTKTRG